MKKIIFISLLGLFSCKQNNPQPNTEIVKNEDSDISYSSCVDTVPWNENVTYGSLIDIDSNEYRTVLIGQQEWMAENLKVTHYSNGDEIPYVFNDLVKDAEWENLTTGGYCWYLEYNSGDTVSYKDCYGGLYNWYTVEDSRNVCPTGWHIPSDDEWTILEDYLSLNGHSGSEGSSLKSTEGWIVGGNGTDDYGFRGLPAGYRFVDGYLYVFRSDARWWSSSEFESLSSPMREVVDFNSVIESGVSSNKKHGFSIRCVRD